MLQEIEENYKDKGVQILGILADNALEMGKQHLSMQNANFVNILPTEELIIGFLDQIVYVPTTIIVNSRGEMMGELVVGAQSYEDMTKLIDDALAQIE